MFQGFDFRVQNRSSPFSASNLLHERFKSRSAAQVVEQWIRLDEKKVVSHLSCRPAPVLRSHGLCRLTGSGRALKRRARRSATLLPHLAGSGFCALTLFACYARRPDPAWRVSIGRDLNRTRSDIQVWPEQFVL